MTGLREHDNNSNADSVSGDEKGGGGRWRRGKHSCYHSGDKAEVDESQDSFTMQLKKKGFY